MKITYTFANGDICEIETDETLSTIISDLDRQEFNNNHSETRRHVSLDEYNKDDNLLPSNSSVIKEIIYIEEFEYLIKAVQTLSFSQRNLFKKHFIDGISVSEIANFEGVSVSAISHKLNRIKNKIKKFYKTRQLSPFPWPTYEEIFLCHGIERRQK